MGLDPLLSCCLIFCKVLIAIKEPVNMTVLFGLISLIPFNARYIADNSAVYIEQLFEILFDIYHQKMYYLTALKHQYI